MDFSIKYASQIALTTILCSLFLYQLTAFIQKSQYGSLSSQNSFVTPSINSSNIELVADKIALKINEEYQLMNYVKAYDEVDGDISYQIKSYDNIDIHQKGYYQARFVVKNSSGKWKDKIVDVRVDE